MKRIIVYVLTISFFHLTGCYYQEQMASADYNFDENVSLYISTNDTTYKLNGNDYFLSNDTLHCITGIKKY